MDEPKADDTKLPDVKKPSLQEAYEFEMDQRMIDVMDPTNFGTDTVYAIDDQPASVEESIEDEVGNLNVKDGKNRKH